MAKHDSGLILAACLILIGFLKLAKFTHSVSKVRIFNEFVFMLDWTSWATKLLVISRLAFELVPWCRRQQLLDDPRTQLPVLLSSFASVSYNWSKTFDKHFWAESRRIEKWRTSWSCRNPAWCLYDHKSRAAVIRDMLLFQKWRASPVKIVRPWVTFWSLSMGDRAVPKRQSPEKEIVVEMYSLSTGIRKVLI